MKVPVYRRQLQPQGVALPRAGGLAPVAAVPAAVVAEPAPSSIGAGGGAGLAALGAGLARAGGALAQVAERRAEADRAIAAIEATAGASHELHALQAQFEEDADYATAEARFAAGAEQIRAKWRPAFGRDDRRAAVFDANFGHAAQIGTTELRRVAARRRTEAALGALAATIDLAEQEAGPARPQAAARVAAALTEARDAGLITAEKAVALQQGFTARQAETDVLRAIRTDPGAAIAALADPARYPGLDALRREQLRGSAEAAARARQAEAEALERAAKAELRAEVRTALSVLGDGQDYAGATALITRAHRAGLPEEAAAVQAARDDVGWTRDLAKLPPAAILGEAEAAQAAAAAATDPAQAARFSARAQAAVRLAERVRQGLAADPLGWAEHAGVVPATRVGAGDALDGQTLDGQNWAARRTQALAAAEARYGLAIPPLKPHEVDGLAQQLGRAESAGEQFEAVAAVALAFAEPGRRAAALDQLVAEAVLPPAAAQVLAEAADVRQRHRARRLFGELNMPPERIALAETDVKAAREDAAQAYETGLGAVRQGAYLATGDARFRELFNQEWRAVEQVTKVRAGAHDDPAASAYADLFGQRATLARDGLAFVTWPAAEADPAAVARGLAALRETGAALLAEQRPGAAPDESTVPGRMFDRALIEATRSEGVWVNWGDGRTFALIIPGAGRPVANPDGTPWRVTLDAVLQAAAALIRSETPARMRYGGP